MNEERGKHHQDALHDRDGGVTIDHCLSCGGIWLDKGEMGKMVSQIKQAESSLDDEFRPLFKEKKEYDKYRYKQKSTYQRIFDILD